MSLLQSVANWLRPFYITPAPNNLRSDVQRRADEIRLRQLRTELELMRKWKTLKDNQDDHTEL